MSASESSGTHDAPDVVEVLELDDEDVAAEPGDDLMEEEASVTERGFDASTFGLPRANGTKLPMANLEMPSPSRLELTPSPVPRVALSPATGAVDISLVPGPHASRNLPTLAAHHAFGRRAARRPASAITFPPPRRASPDSPRLGAGLAKDVRSSKREIVLGLAIGLGLSLLLAAVGQAYMREVPVASSPPPEVESLALSARPESGAPLASSSPALAEPAAPVPVEPSAHGERDLSAQAGNTSGEPWRPIHSTPSAGRSPADRASVPRREHPRREGAASAAGAQQRVAARGKAGAATEGVSGKSFEAPPPARSSLSPAQPATSLSPAESAGLGLDLPL